jgi:hypothetical protein
MASVNSIIQRLEGYVGTLANSGLTASPAVNETQAVSTWLEQVKAVLRAPGNRDLTDWELYIDGSVIKTSADCLAYTGASTLYAALFGTIGNQAQWYPIYDHAAKTFDATAALDALTRGMVYQAASASASYREYTGVVWAHGIAFVTAISIGAEDFDGTDSTANDNSVVLLYRTA